MFSVSVHTRIKYLIQQRRNLKIIIQVVRSDNICRTKRKECDEITVYYMDNMANYRYIKFLCNGS
jgi:hypothetical protein